MKNMLSAVCHSLQEEQSDTCRIWATVADGPNFEKGTLQTSKI